VTPLAPVAPAARPSERAGAEPELSPSDVERLVNEIMASARDDAAPGAS
jgi:hypothetical protein